MEGLSPDIIDSIQEMVAIERDQSLSSMPTERVMRAIKRVSMSESTMDDWLSHELFSWFRPVVATGLFVIALLAAYNFEISKTNDYNQSTTEMVLGLHPVTVNAAYDLTFDDH